MLRAANSSSKVSNRRLGHKDCFNFLNGNFGRHPAGDGKDAFKHIKNKSINIRNPRDNRGKDLDSGSRLFGNLTVCFTRLDQEYDGELLQVHGTDAQQPSLACALRSLTRGGGAGARAKQCLTRHIGERFLRLEFLFHVDHVQADQHRYVAEGINEERNTHTEMDNDHR